LGVQEPSGAVPGENDFVTSERSHLEIDDNLKSLAFKTDKTRPTYLLEMAFQSHLLQRKRPSLSPFFKIKALHPDRQRVLHYMLSDIGLFKPKPQSSMLSKSRELQWKYALKYGLVTKGGSLQVS
jgi:hypothetical protein